MWAKLSRLILQNRILIILFFIVSTVFMGYHAKNLKLSYAGSKILPLTDSVFIKYNTFKKAFGEDGNVMVLGIQSAEIYKKENISERHRHRYEFNNAYKSEFEKAGMICSGINVASNLVEIIELKSHKWYIGVQFHPEYSSTVINPHPLFISFIQAAIQK